MYSYFMFIIMKITSMIHNLSLHDALPISILKQKNTIAIISKVIFKKSKVGTTGLLSRILVVTLLIRPPVIFVDRKSTRLNSSHLVISYAVFCLTNKNIIEKIRINIHNISY